ncbi:hypothetical protein M1329_00180 [Candidatus Marsarchaeota archaeon]|nr:hypothetical protein [Candidatus Marsarchaeota archaeon]MCL5099870.1 hypothetical protein [Candidatus Marsarchaeota archaeon]
MIIQRPEEVRRLETKKWVLVYGRRKTGKTFLVQNFVKYDSYYFVNRDRTIISDEDGVQVPYEVLVDRLRFGAKNGQTIVIDEFHRLGGSFLDVLQSIGAGGKLILVTSTLFLAKQLLSIRSPIMGLFNEVQIPIISLGESLEALSKEKLDNKELVETAIMLREPLAVAFYDKNKNAGEIMGDVLLGSAEAVPALFGEILIEEDKGTTAVFEGIIRAVADGKTTSGEISSSLFSKKLVAKDDPSFVQSYLSTMVKIGLLRRIKVYEKNKFAYKIPSPLMKLFFYADEKYGISQRRIKSIEANRIITELLPHIVEDNIREHIADKLGLQEYVFEAKDYDVDGVLVRFNSVQVVLEVKWGGKVSGEDVRRAEESLGRINAKRRILFVQDKKNVHSDMLEIMDASDL